MFLRVPGINRMQILAKFDFRPLYGLLRPEKGRTNRGHQESIFDFYFLLIFGDPWVTLSGHESRLILFLIKNCLYMKTAYIWKTAHIWPYFHWFCTILTFPPLLRKGPETGLKTVVEKLKKSVKYTFLFHHWNFLIVCSNWARMIDKLSMITPYRK